MARILLVELDAASRVGHQRALERAGHEVLAFPGVNAALGSLARRERGALPVDLMIIELGIPDAHGVDLLTRLRALPGASGLPVLGLAGAADALRGDLDEDVLDDVLLKPVPGDRLARVTGRLLSDGPTDRARLRRLMRHQADLSARLAALAKANEALARSAPLDEVLSASLRGYIEAEAFDLAVVLQVEPEPRVLACACPSYAGAGPRVAQEGALLRAALEAQAPLLLPDAGGGALLDDLRLATTWLAPLIVDGERVAVAVFGSAGGGLRQAEGFIAAVCGQLALAAQVSRTLGRLAASEERFRRMAQELPRGLVTAEDGRVRYLNAAAAQLLGVDATQVVGAPLVGLLGPPEGAPDHLELRRGGRVLALERRRFVDEEGGEHLTLLLDDVTRRRRREATLTEQALTDPLTGLGNRRYLESVGPELLEEQRALGRPTALLFLDLDHFKEVNDVRGHAVGDTLLRALGRALAAHLRPGDLISRLGGDEFAVLMGGLGPAAAASRAEGLRAQVLSASAEVLGAENPVDVSVGVAVDQGGPLSELIHAADLAMYQAKREGRGRVAVYSTTSR
ncbi:MAG: diguanylate cyclase [Alphaproteobacteria bacterium]|nr:diguanylate cyclase [Alphaproteobacteria bacterium]